MPPSAEANAADRDQPSSRRPPECPVEDWLAFLGHRWNALTLWHLSTGSKRFGDLMTCLPGITPKVLSDRLDGLVQRGLLCRQATDDFPRATRYTLSASGIALVGVLDQLEAWSKNCQAPIP